MGRRGTVIFVVANLVLINWAILAYLNLKYPFVGHDYIGLPYILDSALHFRLNGFSIQWFSPSFGGGIPAFPHPNNGQFSLVVLLAVFLPPWQAVMISTVVYVSVGIVACEHLLRRILGFQSVSSVLGAVFFSANGYMMERVAVGHIGYVTFPLLAVFLVLLLDTSLSVLIASALMGLLLGLLIHFAGYFVIIIFCMSILIVLPVIFIIDPTYLNWKRILAVCAFGGIAGFLISISKLVAVFSFMRFFSRIVADEYQTSILTGMFGLVLQMLGVMNLVPLLMVAGINPDQLPNYMYSASRADYGIWEMDMSMTPLVFIILIIGVDMFFHHPKKYFARATAGGGKYALLFFFLMVWVVVEFTLARGVIYNAFRNFPILASLHVNPRFAASFIFPLSFFAALLLDRWLRSQALERHVPILLILNLISLIPLGAYFVFREDILARFYDVRRAQAVYERMQRGDSFEVLSIGTVKDNTEALYTNTSNLKLYDPIFGYELEYFNPQIREGSIWEVSDGYYNMTNPIGFVYPDTGKSLPFERFRIEDEETLRLFAKHLQPKWQIPTYQSALNWVSAVSCLLCIACLVFGRFVKV